MNCPFCAYPVTRNFGHQEVYWFCHHCWQEVPEFERSLSLPSSLSRIARQEGLVEHIQSRVNRKRKMYALPNS